MVPIGSVATFAGQDRPVPRDALQPVPGGRGRRRHRARLLRPASRWRRWRSSRRACRRASPTEWTDIAFQQKRRATSPSLVFALAVVFVFLVLAAQFESLLLPLAIILIVPMTLLAAMAGVNLRGHGQQHPDPDRPDRADRAGGEECDPDRRVRQAGRGARRSRPIEAAVEAARTRLRPILMTSFAFILGALPLVIASGPGWELRQALGTAVFFGMIGVTAFGLIFTPVFYVATPRARRAAAASPRRPAADAAARRCCRRNEELDTMKRLTTLASALALAACAVGPGLCPAGDARRRRPARSSRPTRRRSSRSRRSTAIGGGSTTIRSSTGWSPTRSRQHRRPRRGRPPRPGARRAARSEGRPPAASRRQRSATRGRDAGQIATRGPASMPGSTSPMRSTCSAASAATSRRRAAMSAPPRPTPTRCASRSSPRPRAPMPTPPAPPSGWPSPSGSSRCSTESLELHPEAGRGRARPRGSTPPASPRCATSDRQRFRPSPPSAIPRCSGWRR